MHVSHCLQPFARAPPQLTHSPASARWAYAFFRRSEFFTRCSSQNEPSTAGHGHRLQNNWVLYGARVGFFATVSALGEVMVEVSG